MIINHINQVIKNDPANGPLFNWKEACYVYLLKSSICFENGIVQNGGHGFKSGETCFMSTPEIDHGGWRFGGYVEGSRPRGDNIIRLYTRGGHEPEPLELPKPEKSSGKRWWA